MSELISKKSLLRGVGALALTAMLWMAPVQAQAQLVVDSPNADIEENANIVQTTATAAATTSMSITEAAEFVWKNYRLL